MRSPSTEKFLRWVTMELLSHLLSADPASPRLTVYNEATGARIDFSAQTLDNWASKIANMLEEELELTEGSLIRIDVPVSWQAAVIALGALAARVDVDFASAPLSPPSPSSSSPVPDTIFCAADTVEQYCQPNGDNTPVADVVVVSDDPFGRGITETGGTIPVGTLDFGPTVRFYGDGYFGNAPKLIEVTGGNASNERLLSTGWHDFDSFKDAVLVPLAGGGSAVVVTGLASAERLADIAAAERTTSQL